MNNILDILLLIFIAGIGYWIYKYNHGKKSSYKDNSNLKRKILNMSPREFEVFTANLFTDLGYKAKITPSGHDGGKDIVLKKYRQTYYVECKHYKGSVGRPILQKLAGAAYGDNIPVKNCKVVTTGYFTKGAKEYAHKTNIELLELKDILTLANKTNLSSPSKRESKRKSA